MCGILGQINFNGSISKIQKIKLNKSLSMLEHRGPDAEGTFTTENVFLGHRRLSIIDTNSRSNQPFIYKEYVLVFNGEIYNFKHLKEKLEKKGYKFNTTSDTEVLIKGLAEFGDRFVDMMDGMWAFCLYNKKKKTILISRDRIGERPLYYYKDSEKLIFASELPPLLKLLKKEEKTIDYKRLAQFNLYNLKHIPGKFTPFEMIKKLMPGYNLFLNNDQLSFKKYFKIHKETIKEPVKIFDEVFNSCVTQTMISDVPVGLLFSGGIDTSLIASVLDKKTLNAYCFGWDKNDAEIIRAREVAKELNMKFKEVYFDQSECRKNFLEKTREIIRLYGEPINLFQIAYSEIILKEMRNDGIKVAIGGNGADEIFYGYDGANKTYLISTIKELADKYHLGGSLGILPQTRLLTYPAWKTKAKIYEAEMEKRSHIRQPYRKFILSDLFEEVANEIPSKKLIDVFNWIGLRIENEASITIVADLAGMRESMEIRTPFLNKLMLDFSLSLDNKYKVTSFFSKKNNKYILKKALESYVPKALIYQKKMGFGYNISPMKLVCQLIKENKNLFERYIEEIVPEIGLYDKEVIEGLFREHLRGEKDNSNTLWEVLIVCLWWEEFVNKP